MPDPVLGVVAALGGPVVMSLGLIMWEGAWPGSAMMLNAVKNCIASLLFLAIVPFRLDTWRRGLGLDLREGDSREDVARMDMLVLSSVLGIAISDNMWLAALRILGTRKVPSPPPLPGSLAVAVASPHPSAAPDRAGRLRQAFCLSHPQFLHPWRDFEAGGGRSYGGNHGRHPTCIAGGFAAKASGIKAL